MQRKQNIHKLISSILLVVFFIPITILAFHSLTDHHHQICFSKTQQHIHDKDVDCTLHLLKQGNSNLESIDYQIFESIQITSIDNLQHSFLKNHQQLSFSLRGPPLSVLT